MSKHNVQALNTQEKNNYPMKIIKNTVIINDTNNFEKYQESFSRK